MDWLKDCEICNAGLCKAVDERKGKGMSERAACRDMSKESDGLWSENQILNRYRYHTNKKSVCQIDTERDCGVCEIHTEELTLTEDEILKAADKIREKRLAHWQQEARNLGCFVENYMETDVYKFNPCGLEMKRPSTKEEWLEYGYRIKALLESINKRPEKITITQNDIPCCSCDITYED